MSMNQRFDSLMIKYGIDRFHPRFGASLQAVRLIQDLVKKNTGRSWIVLSDNSYDAGFFCVDAGGAEIRQTILYSELTNEILESLKNCPEDSLIIIVSFVDRYATKNRLENLGIHPLCLYDYFAVNGLCISGNYYDVFGEKYLNESVADETVEKGTYNYSGQDVSALFFYDRRGFECAEKREYQQMFLAKMIFDCAYARDIESMSLYIKKYTAAKFDHSDKYQRFAEEANALVSEIRDEISRREQKDMVMFWLDALESGEDRTMKWLTSVAERSLEFEQAYTTTPYTHSSARALFGGKYLLDDRAYNMKIDDSCQLILDLKKRGYRVVFYTFLPQISDELRVKRPQNKFAPFTRMCWDFACDLIQSEEPVFAMLQELKHTHWPFTSIGLTGTEYISPAYYEAMNGMGSTEQLRSQMEESRRYTDQVLQYYSGLLNEHMFKIYMSDHGHTYFDKFHTVLKVVQEDIRPQKIDKIFSFVHFGSLIKKLLDGDTDYQDILSEYTVIQDTDYYYRNAVRYILKHNPKWSRNYFGYEGVVTKNGYYLRYNDGREEYYNLNAGDPVTREWVEEAESLCGRYPDDIIVNEKFKYSRNLYATLNRYLDRNKSFEDSKQKALIDIFEQLPETAVVALRGGGEHSYQLWLTLPWRLRRKISYVIDRDPQCMASRVGLPIISLEQIQEKGVSHVMPSSFIHEAEWTEELQKMQGSFKIIPLYAELKKHNVVCREAFYYKEYIEEDIVWEE